MGTPDSSSGQELNTGENQDGEELFQWFTPGPHDDFEIVTVHHNHKIVKVKKTTKQNPVSRHGSLKIIETREIGTAQISAIDEYFRKSILREMDGYDGETARRIYSGMNYVNKARRKLELKKGK